MVLIRYHVKSVWSCLFVVIVNPRGSHLRLMSLSFGAFLSQSTKC